MCTTVTHLTHLYVKRVPSDVHLTGSVHVDWKVSAARTSLGPDVDVVVVVNHLQRLVMSVIKKKKIRFVDLMFHVHLLTIGERVQYSRI